MKKLSRVGETDFSKGEESWMDEISCSSIYLVQFTKQLAVMFKGGIPLVECLQALTRQSECHNLAVTAQAIVRHLESGQKLSHSLQRFPRIFPPVYVAMVRVGEQTGELHECFERTGFGWSGRSARSES